MWHELKPVRRLPLCLLRPDVPRVVQRRLLRRFKYAKVAPLVTLADVPVTSRGHALEAVVSRLIDDALADIDSDAGELQSIMLALEKDQLSQEIDSLTRRMASDPLAYERIKQLNGRLAVLKKAPLV